jgi:DNA-binding transcriptional MerR regulator
MAEQKIKKLYYSISEVSQITSLKAYVLRYWETEFAELRPKKSRAGSRTYTLEDIKLIFLIKRLLYEDKYTIEGARQRLQHLRRVGEQIDLSFEQLRRDDLLSELKKELRELLAILKNGA